MSFSEKDMKAFEPEAKIGLLATVSPEGLPHVTLITSIQAGGPESLIWGQFSEGQSKKNVKSNPKTGFLILTMDRKMWTGKAVWKEEKTQGPEFEMYNEKPMFRYNAYFGIHTVHYMDLVESAGPRSLPLASMAAAMAATRVAGAGKNGANSDPVLKPWAKSLFNRLDAMKFISWIGEDGFPVITPILQATAPSDDKIVFSPLAFSKELSSLETGETAAVFGLTMKMEDVLARGFFRGFSRKRGVSVGTVDLNWAYNSMPPTPGQIYPPVELKPVTEF